MIPDDIDILRSQVAEAGSIRGAARFLKLSESSLRRWLKAGSGYTVDPLPSTSNIQELIASRIERFKERKAQMDGSHIRVVRLKSNETIGVGFQGDGHLDDDGTDIQQFFQHANLFDGRNAGLHLGFLGDIFNNWTGKLARLWADQSSSAKEAQALIEHYFTSYNFLFVLLGNHDVWNSQEPILQHLLRATSDITAAHEQRIRLVFPNGRQVMIHARHKFPGSSMWSTQFGQMKAAQLDGQADIYVGGDKHTSGYSNGVHPGSKRLYHALQVASYKKLDEYPIELGLAQKDLYVCPVAIINPRSTDPVNLIKWEFDPHEGAERLKWERQRHH